MSIVRELAENVDVPRCRGKIILLVLEALPSFFLSMESFAKADFIMRDDKMSQMSHMKAFASVSFRDVTANKVKKLYP